GKSIGEPPDRLQRRRRPPHLPGRGAGAVPPLARGPADARWAERRKGRTAKTNNNQEPLRRRRETMRSLFRTLAVAATLLAAATAQAQEPIVITHVNTLTGALRAYGEQLHIGLRLGFEYATDGTMTVEGRPIRLLERDD